MSGQYNLGDVVKSYIWLGHKGLTELNAFHTDYQPGRENFGWNLKHQTFPVIRYARHPDEALKFVEKYSGSRTVCYGLNPRVKVYKNTKGFPRSAFEVEISVSQNLLFDFDIESKTITAAQIAAFKQFLEKADERFQDFGLRRPVKAYTGRGFHLLFAYPAIQVSEHPDISARLAQFRDGFDGEHRQELASLEAKLDSTQDLRRMARIYGTAKPKLGIISEFYGESRVEDEFLREYLLSLKLPAREIPVARVAPQSHGELPNWFLGLIEKDLKVAELWIGLGKPDGTDTSRSGFDYSLVRRLMQLGHRNIDELATVLALRPNGGVLGSGKGDEYVRRTIAAALIRQ